MGAPVRLIKEKSLGEIAGELAERGKMRTVKRVLYQLLRDVICPLIQESDLFVGSQNNKGEMVPALTLYEMCRSLTVRLPEAIRARDYRIVDVTANRYRELWLPNSIEWRLFGLFSFTDRTLTGYAEELLRFYADASGLPVKDAEEELKNYFPRDN